MDLEKPPVARPTARQQEAEGCLVVAIRVPVRIVALVLVVPVRMAWDALVGAGRFLGRTVFRPLGRALSWVGKLVGKFLIVRPLGGLWRYVLLPVGRALALLVKVLVVVPAVWCYARVLTPVGHAVAWSARYLVVIPLYWTVRVLVVLPAHALWRWVLVPVGRFLAVLGREILDALGHAWRVAGWISRVVGRFLGTLLRWIFVEPVRWVYRTVLTPVGHVLRDAVLRPVAEVARSVGRAGRQAVAAALETVRQVRADVRRALVGEPRRVEPVSPREPVAPVTRTLDSSTTSLTKD